jgi:3-oxoacyl-[acyl-carrier protein] reductase
MFSLTDKVAVVTGAGRGIGQAIAQTLASAGAKVAIISRTEANSSKVAALINESHPGCAKPYAVDIADSAAVAEMGKTVLADFGRVDILVNNAGLTRDGLALRMSEEDWDLVLDTNLKGAFNAVKAFQRSILKSTAGRIINISSVVGLTGAAGQINYAASKAGLIGFTKSVAREFAGRGVTSNAIAPGFIDTDMTHVLSDDIKAGIKAKIPLNSFGTVDDIAQAVLFLASPAARYITGQVLTVDGGLVM